jgi:hypothetical protein
VYLLGVVSSKEVVNTSHKVSVKGTKDKKRKEIDEKWIQFILYPQLSYFNGLFKSGNLTEKISSVN